MNLSKNFTLEELTHSATALRNGIDNTPNEKQIENLTALVVNILQPIRDFFGKPINITSGFRCDSLNFAVGSVSGSQHTKGEAVDFTCADNDFIFNFIRYNLEFDQLIWEYGDFYQPSWVHVSLRKENNRKEVLRVGKGGDGHSWTEVII